jgi:hypothetical protein
LLAWHTNAETKHCRYIAFEMEEPRVTFEQRENYLLVTGHGERNNFADIIEATTQINEMVVKFQNKYLLIDYRKVKFNTPITNVFDVVRIYESKMPHLKNIFIAAVLSQLNSAFGKYWRDIAQQRGFNFMVFDDFAKAELWMLEQCTKPTKSN